jgi:2-polyprenyl-3-methyl-5-hydroxy-6-metoxy-1,4-benzoquinol methylase
MKPWWQKLFDASYLKVYRHTAEGAEGEVEFLIDELQLEPDDRVLDLCCGFGRHAIALTHRDMRVTGVDFSRVLLREGKRHARAAGVQVEWAHSDVREFRSRKRYHAVLNLFTAFGYFENEAEDERLMQVMAKHLRPGGRICIDTANRDFILRHFKAQNVSTFEGGHAIDFNTVSGETGRMECERVLYFDGKSKKQHVSLRLYTGRELALMAERCGLVVEAFYGGFDRRPLSMDAHRLILIARRPE